MTTPMRTDRSVSDPIGLIVDLVAALEHQLPAERIRAVATAVAGGRAKSRRLAAALAERPGVLADGRSPAPRAVGDLLLGVLVRNVSPDPNGDDRPGQRVDAATVEPGLERVRLGRP